MIPTLFAAVLERAIRHYLQLDPESLARLGTLSGKVIQLELSGWKSRVFLLPSSTEINLQTQYEGLVDVTIKGSPLALLRLGLVMRQKKAVTDVEGVVFEGDMETAQAFGLFMQQIDIDGEALLSRLLGDTVAHQIGNVMRRFKRWGESTFTSTSLNITDYLQEEIRQLPPSEEVEDFFSDIHRLRDDLARLEVKILSIK